VEFEFSDAQKCIWILGHTIYIMISKVLSFLSAWLITIFLLVAFAPVVCTILDIVKVMVLRVIGHPHSQCQITMLEVPNGTAAIQEASFRVQKGLQCMLEHILRDNLVTLSLNSCLFEGDIMNLDSNGQKGNQEDTMYCIYCVCSWG
jgi:hypothetical protein